jgi:FixJ family two-component response regulator
MKPLVHVVDDDDSLRQSLLDLLQAAGYDASGYGSTGEFLLHELPDRPSCLLLDVRLPGPSGLELQEALGRRGLALPIVFLTGHADVSMTVRAVKGGAVDVLEKPVARESLLRAIAAALDRDAEERAAVRMRSQRDARLGLLTPREREVFDRIVAGQRNREIAAALGIGLRTVKAHRSQLMTKLGVTTAAVLGRLAGGIDEHDDDDAPA